MRKLTRKLILISIVMITACGPLRHPVPVTGTLEHVQIDTTVDDPIARYYIERQTTAATETKNWDAVIVEIHSDLGPHIPSREQLALWSNKYSTDFATLILARQLLRNAQKQPLYQRYSNQLNSGDIDQKLEINADVLFLFVPGWLYKTDPSTGADFSDFRKVLREHGANTALLQTKENGSVTENAEIIAEKLRQLAISSKTPTVIVSASKGGPETAVALSMIKQEDAADNIKAWINVGGLLRGTPLADTAVTWPFCWFVEIAVLPDCSFDGVRGLTVANSMRRFREFNLPDHILIVNYLGVPLSGDISKQAKDGYRWLRDLGPNDGLTLLADALYPSGITIPEFGADHYFRQVNIETKALSLAMAVVRQIEENSSQQGTATDRISVPRPPAAD